MHNLRTYRYAPVTHGGTTVSRDYGMSHNTTHLNIHTGSRGVSYRHNISQFGDSLSTAHNTFHIYGICLNRNRKVYSLSKFGQSDPKLSVLTLTMEVTKIYLLTSNRTNRRITIYFKGYAFNVYPINSNTSTLKQNTRKS